MRISRYWLLVFFTAMSLISYSQIPDSALQASLQLPDKYYSKVDKKITGVNEQFTKKSLKYLLKFQRQERKLQEKMQKLNPNSAVGLLPDATEKYTELSGKIKSKTAGVTKVMSGEYSPYMDSLGTSLSFLQQFNGVGSKVKEPLRNFNLLQGKLQESEKIKAFIADRKNQIKEVLSKYTKIPGSLKKQYDNLSKSAYYYSAQVKEYKDMLKDQKKVEQKALGMLNKLPAFQKFMKQNGQLASLFRLPDNNDPSQTLAGLQTRSSVQSLIQERVSAGGPNGMAQIQENLAGAHAELNKLKDKLNGLTGGSGELDMPDFKPNTEKLKKFLKRLEYSADVQFAKSSNLLPSVANVGLGLGYKLNEKNVIGIGLNYKLGMGNIKHISFTSQGLGIRSYTDWKIKKQIFLSGGYEFNYNSAFKNIEQLKNYDAWQRSALFGVSKKYKISNKVKGEMKILYDFLSNQHIPVSQAVIFRFGYKF